MMIISVHTLQQPNCVCGMPCMAITEWQKRIMGMRKPGSCVILLQVHVKFLRMAYEQLVVAHKN